MTYRIVTIHNLGDQDYQIIKVSSIVGACGMCWSERLIRHSSGCWMLTRIYFHNPESAVYNTAEHFQVKGFSVNVKSSFAINDNVLFRRSPFGPECFISPCSETLLLHFVSVVIRHSTE